MALAVVIIDVRHLRAQREDGLARPLSRKRERVLSVRWLPLPSLDNDLRFAIRLAQDGEQIAESERDATLGRREIRARDMEKDGAADAGNHRHIAVAERHDEIVDRVLAP